jgi:hypothetical protein
MRRFVGIVLMLVAVVALVIGTGLAFLLGTDNRTATGPHKIETSAPVVVTRPDVLDWAGPSITLTVDVADGQEVFIGAANAVDVADYVGAIRRTEITDYRPPWKIETEDVFGEDILPADPETLDWWVARGSGTGTATMSVELPEQAFALVVIAVGGGDLEGMRVTAAYDLAGGFGIGLGLVGFAIGLGLFGWIAFQGRPMTRYEEIDEDEEGAYEQQGERR